MPDYSIIICTYNPEIRIIKRCLKAVQKLESNGLSFEVIVVENNCKTPLNNDSELKEILSAIKNLRVIEEPKPGLSNARIAGVQNSNSPWLVFFDDDNEAKPDYLIGLSTVIAKYPTIGIWGPGEVTVDFLDKTDNWIEKNCRDTFQEKKFTQVEYAMEKIWNRCYPPGSGICIRKDIFLKYVENYTSKKFKTTGRTGNSLISAEDNQIIYTSIFMGYPVGTTPDLKLNHLIPAAKANFNYVKKLRFFVRYSIPLANVEVYPELLQKYKSEQRSKFFLFIQLNKYLLIGILTGKIKESVIDCILISGNYTGVNLVLNRKNPAWLRLFLKIIGIEIN